MGYYSQLRPHQYNGGLTPTESERLFWKNSKAVANFCGSVALRPRQVTCCICCNVARPCL